MINLILWLRILKARYLLVISFLLLGISAHAETTLISDANSPAFDQNSARAVVEKVARYEYLLGNYFQSLSEVSLAEEQYVWADDRASNAQQLKLMQAKLYQYFDMESDAYQLYRGYLAADKTTEQTPTEHRNIWLKLAQQAYLHSDITIASKALTQYQRSNKQEKPDQYYYLLGQIALKNNAEKAAQQALDEISINSPLRRYLMLNQALSNVANGKEEIAIRQLQQVTLLTATEHINDEVNALINKAYLSLGYLYLQRASFEQAQTAFRAVSLAVPETESALLGSGWAALSLNEYNSALAMFQQLTQATKMTPYVQEAYIAIPYILEQMNESNKAHHAYLAAVQRFDDYLVVLSNAIATTQHEDFITTWLVADPVLAADFPTKQAIKGQGFSLALPVEINTYELVASHRFQKGLKEHRDVAAIIAQLQYWQSEFSINHRALSSANSTPDTSNDYAQRIDSQLSKASVLQQSLQNELSQQVKQSLMMQLENVQDYRQAALIAIAKINDQVFEQQQPVVAEFSLGDRPTVREFNE